MTREEIEEAYLRAFAAGDKEGMQQIGAVLKRLDEKPSTAMDVAKGAATGYSGALAGLMGGAMGAKMGIPADRAAGMAKAAVGAEYEPETRAGKYAQRIGAGASFGPGGLPAAVTGAAGGALSQLAEEQGYNDPVSQTAAWMLPALVTGGVKAMHPGAAQKDLRSVLSQMTPEERMATGLTMKQAAERKVPLSLWQAAPEGSTLYEAGASVAPRAGADKMQAALREQIGMGDQAWVRSMTEEAFKPVVEQAVSPRLVERIARAVNQIGVKRHLDPKSKEEVAKVAELFGKHVPGDQQAFVEQLIAQLKKAPPGPQQAKFLQQVQLASQGKLKAPSVFQPKVTDAGEVISAKGRVEGGMPEFASMKQGTMGDIREAIDVKMRPIPGYREAMENYGTTKKIAEIVARDQTLRGKQVRPQPEHQARLTAEATVPYALATNPWWASVPFFRNWAGKQVMAKLDKALASKNFAAIEKIAAENPQLEALVQTMLQVSKGQAVLPDANVEQTLREYLPKGPQ